MAFPISASVFLFCGAVSLYLFMRTYTVYRATKSELVSDLAGFFGFCVFGFLITGNAALFFAHDPVLLGIYGYNMGWIFYPFAFVFLIRATLRTYFANLFPAIQTLYYVISTAALGAIYWLTFATPHLSIVDKFGLTHVRMPFPGYVPAMLVLLGLGIPGSLLFFRAAFNMRHRRLRSFLLGLGILVASFGGTGVIALDSTPLLLLSFLLLGLGFLLLILAGVVDPKQ